MVTSYTAGNKQLYFLPAKGAEMLRDKAGYSTDKYDPSLHLSLGASSCLPPLLADRHQMLGQQQVLKTQSQTQTKRTTLREQKRNFSICRAFFFVCLFVCVAEWLRITFSKSGKRILQIFEIDLNVYRQVCKTTNYLSPIPAGCFSCYLQEKVHVNNSDNIHLKHIGCLG